MTIFVQTVIFKVYIYDEQFLQVVLSSVSAEVIDLSVAMIAISALSAMGSVTTQLKLPITGDRPKPLSKEIFAYHEKIRVQIKVSRSVK